MDRATVSILIKRSALIFDKRANQLLAPHQLTGSQFRILMTLYHSPACSVRQTDVETMFSMTNPTVTGLVDKLERRRLVARVSNPNDKRSKLLVLTDHAEEQRAEFLALAGAIEAEMTAGLTDAEIELLSGLLQKVIDRHLADTP